MMPRRKRYKITFSKALTVYANTKADALEEACGKIADRFFEYDASFRDYMNAKVWETGKLEDVKEA